MISFFKITFPHSGYCFLKCLVLGASAPQGHLYIPSSYLISVFEAPPVSCRGGARFPATIPTGSEYPSPGPSPLSPGDAGTEGRRAGGGVGGGAYFVARNPTPPRHEAGGAGDRKALNTYPSSEGLGVGSSYSPGLVVVHLAEASGSFVATLCPHQNMIEATGIARFLWPICDITMGGTTCRILRLGIL